jgi:hypothetical protein
VADRIYPWLPNPFPSEFCLDIVTIFCDIDDFCRPLLTAQYPPLAAPGHPGKFYCGRLTLSEGMTILVFFHASHYRTFKHFYFAHMLGPRRGEFPALPRYTRFVELIPLTLLPRCAYVQTRKGPVTGLQFIDSMPIRVCHNRRIAVRIASLRDWRNAARAAWAGFTVSNCTWSSMNGVKCWPHAHAR